MGILEDVQALRDQVRILSEEIRDRKQRVAEISEELRGKLSDVSSVRRQHVEIRRAAKEALDATKEKRKRRAKTTETVPDQQPVDVAAAAE